MQQNFAILMYLTILTLILIHSIGYMDLIFYSMNNIFQSRSAKHPI